MTQYQSYVLFVDFNNREFNTLAADFGVKTVICWWGLGLILPIGYFFWTEGKDVVPSDSFFTEIGYDEKICKK